MSALGHDIEAQGVATASISLIREHSERMRPPRALWVPFDLGRPLGEPGDREFQLRVLRSLLGLFSRPAGPVLEDFPDDAPSASSSGDAWSCVLPQPPLTAAANERERISQAIHAEIAGLEPWYDVRVAKTSRTSVGLSGLGVEAIPAMVDVIAGYAAGDDPDLPPGISEGVSAGLRLIADDLKAFYLEAAAAQPGGTGASASALNRWLYHGTHLGAALFRIRDRFAAAGDPTPPPSLIPGLYRDRPVGD